MIYITTVAMHLSIVTNNNFGYIQTYVSTDMGIFLLKCVKLTSFFILQTYASTNTVAL